MQRIATLTAVGAVLGGAMLAVMGTFGPDMPTEAGGLDRNSAGILAGAFVGAAVALLSHTLVATALKIDTEAAFKALLVGFFAKLAGAILPWAALSYIPQVARLADPTAYLIAFAVVVVLVLGGGLLDHLRAVTSESPSTDDATGPKGPAGNGLQKSPNEFEAGSSDRSSGSAFSLPRKLPEGSRTGPEAGLSSPVPPPVSSSGSGATTLESAS